MDVLSGNVDPTGGEGGGGGGDSGGDGGEDKGPYNPAIMTLPWFCDFGNVLSDPDTCDCLQDTDDQFDWTFWSRGTPTEGTGPPQSGYGTHGECPQLIYTLVRVYSKLTVVNRRVHVH